MVLTADIKILFSQQAFDCFKELEVMIGPNLGPTGGGNVEACINARDMALCTPYTEAVSPRLFKHFGHVARKPDNALEQKAREINCFLQGSLAAIPQSESVRLCANLVLWKAFVIWKNLRRLKSIIWCDILALHYCKHLPSLK